MHYPRNAAAAAAMLLLATVSTVSAFTDVKSNTPYNEAIESLNSSGIVEGYADGTFRPASRINRAEFLKIVLESRGYEAGEQNCFPDVRGEWFAKYVCAAQTEGIVAGYPDGYFRPEREINFVEAAKILSLAYGQDVSASSPDWYEPYARALESSFAIPPSIGSLDQKISRGEMAEMMWRLKEQITDEPAKGFLNVKYPQMRVNLAAAIPQRAAACADLQVFTEEAGRSGYGGRFDRTMMLEGVPSMAGVQADESRAVDYSQTNVQVSGVDEGDIVKTDGEYLYIIRNQEVRIVRATPADDLKNVAAITLSDSSFTPSDLYVSDGRLVVIGSSWEDGGPVRIMGEGMGRAAESMIWPEPWGNRTFTVARIYNIANPSDPKLERTVSFEGNLVSTRRIGDRLYIVSNQPPRFWGGPVPLPAVREDDVIPMMKDSARGGGVEPAVPCGDVVILPRVPSPSFLLVGVIPMEDGTGEVKRSVVLGSGENVYASLENLYVASTDWNYVWDTSMPESRGSREQTRLYRFAFTGDGVSFKAQGSVPGRILNQFSMDEHERNFRIATTLESRWSPQGNQLSSNNLYILNSDMETVGFLEGIAQGESIYSTRFLGERAYMVTFKKIDPLFVLDLSNPESPAILGKLKIPGYNDYLHPYDENHILGFGKEAVEAKEGDFAWYQGMKIALFDVSDVANPKVLHSIVIGDRGTESPLLSNHKALLFEKERDLLAFPVRINEINEQQKQFGDPGSAYGNPVFQGAQVYTLTLDEGFTLRGTITHYTQDDWRMAGDYVYGKDIDRILRIGTHLYTVSAWGVESHTEKTVEQEGALSFDASVSGTGESCPDEGDPDVHYVSKDPTECARLRFSCIPGLEAFSDLCGCGCKPVPSQ